MRSGSNFPPEVETFCRVVLKEERFPQPARVLKTKETRLMRGMAAPKWGERVSLTGVHVQQLQVFLFIWL